MLDQVNHQAPKLPISERDFAESVKISALLGAAAFKALQGEGAHLDAELIHLGIDFDRRLAEVNQLTADQFKMDASVDRDALDDATGRFDIVHDVLCGVEEAIMSIPAKTAAGLLVKAKIARHRCFDREQLAQLAFAQEDQDHEVRCMSNLFSDLERLAKETVAARDGAAR
jgi:hypothetical protein